MNYQVYAVGVGLVLAVLAGTALITRPDVVREEVNVGAVTGPVQTENDVSIGGTQFRYVGKPFTATSSVFCSIRAPGATSTLLYAGASGKLLAVATTVYLSTSTTGYASSTPNLIARLAVAASANFSSIWQQNSATSTNFDQDTDDLMELDNWDTGESRNVLAPNIFVNWQIATSTGGIFATFPSGHCSAGFMVI